MPDTYNYPAEIERDEDGRLVVTFPDFGWGATDGATRDEALAEGKDLLRELIATTIREGEDLPEPSQVGKDQALIVPPVQIALKAALYEAWRQAGISQRRLARDPRCRRERGAAHAEPRAQHQGWNNRPCAAPAGQAGHRHRWRSGLSSSPDFPTAVGARWRSTRTRSAGEDPVQRLEAAHLEEILCLVDDQRVEALQPGAAAAEAYSVDQRYRQPGHRVA